MYAIRSYYDFVGQGAPDGVRDVDDARPRFHGGGAPFDEKAGVGPGGVFGADFHQGREAAGEGNRVAGKAEGVASSYNFV